MRDIMNNAGDLRSIVLDGFREKDGVFYFVETPGDVEPAHKRDPTNKARWSPWRIRNFEFLKRELSFFPDHYVLADVGAGQSRFREIYERFHYVGVDFYPYEKVRVVCDLNRSLSFKDARVDVIVTSNTLEHIAEPNTFLAECRRVLKPGGVLLGTVPFMINVHQRPYDFYRYTDINLLYLLKKHGFLNIEIEPVVIPSALLFVVAQSFFVHLIERSEYSKNRFFQKLYVFICRVLWKITRVTLRLFEPIFVKGAGDVDFPLGYHFKARVQ